MSNFTDQAADRLEAVGDLTPGYAAVLVNLAGDIRAAGNGIACEHGGTEWADDLAAVLLGIT
jgi:hypothetical protein